MQTYLEESLQRDIERIREQVLDMSRRVELALQDCVRSYLENNRKLAYAVILRDQYIDQKEKEIDRLCLEFIIRQQPVAGPLRFAYSTIKINLEIERVGDYAESIARKLLKIRATPEVFGEGLISLSKLAIGMFHDAIRAFFDQDADLAKQTILVEETVDALRSELNGKLVSEFKEQRLTFEALDPLMTIVRRFERVADQARNICMEVLYMCTGEYVKHPGAEAIRVLFVDDHNSCRSQIAEAIAHGMKQPRFIFSSAGLEPKPIDRTTIDFMKDKGFDLSRTAPRAVHQVPHLDHYQVIVALSRGAGRAFPQHPGKVVYLDWLVENPLEATSEEVHRKLEETFRFLENQVHDLIDAIIRTDGGLDGK